MKTSVNPDYAFRLVEGRLENPFEVLGPHQVVEAGRQATAVRAFLPQSKQAWLIDQAHGAAARPMRRIHPAGLYEAVCPFVENGGPGRYLIQFADERGQQVTMHDPYAFPPFLTEYDKYLLNEGTHWRSYERLGAHERTIEGVAGVNFCVWAPNAERVSVVGDFNQWDGRRHPMRKHVPAGIWELFVPGLTAGTIYKFQVKHGDLLRDKADPYGFAAELPPRTASIAANLDQYAWQDEEWIARRAERNALTPISLRSSPG